VTAADLPAFDYIIAMDRKNLEALRSLAAHGATGHIRLLTAFVAGANDPDVPDPWYTGNFEAVYDLVDAGCRRLLAQIRTEHGL
jgi:protein-tyrosine phosphatase